jgi:hypothetical protein
VSKPTREEVLGLIERLGVDLDSLMKVTITGNRDVLRIKVKSKLTDGILRDYIVRNFYITTNKKEDQ